MKRHLVNALEAVAALTVLFLLAVVLSGCSLLERKALRPVLGTNLAPALSLTNVTTVTNVTVLPATNGQPAAVVQTVEPVVTVEHRPARLVVVTNGWEVAPEAQAAVGTITTVGNAVQPGAGSVAGLVASGALALLAAWKNRKAKVAVEALVATVQGVEDYRRVVRKGPAGLDENALGALSSRQANAPGAALELIKSTVDRYTSKTK